MKDYEKVFKELHDRQNEKLDYYLLALTTSAIAFAVYTTQGEGLSCTQIPLALAVISWAVSVWLGFERIRLVNAATWNNKQYLDMLDGNYKPESMGTQAQKKLASEVKKFMEKNSDSANFRHRWQYRLFLLGMIFFIIWHINEMYNVAHCS